jgi:SAM-dependent MidA family methyltransferase
MIKQWIDTNAKVPFRVVELGPGRGTLMDDILRVGDVEWWLLASHHVSSRF